MLLRLLDGGHGEGRKASHERCIPPPGSPLDTGVGHLFRDLLLRKQEGLDARDSLEDKKWHLGFRIH